MNTDTPPGPQHLAPTRWIESEHPAVQAFAQEHAVGDTPRERAVSLYLAVRERLRETMKTDVFAWHGYTSLWIDGAWRKATPAFNIELCDRFGLLPLEFDGENDSLYHPFDREGRQHMEYVNEHGAFDDLPLERMRAVFSELYPYMLVDVEKVVGDFAADAARETGRA
jgi:transglutaminase-like putative cysteine protease